MKRWIPAVLLILLVCPAPVLAQTKVGIQVDAGDKPLQIKGLTSAPRGCLFSTTVPSLSVAKNTSPSTLTVTAGIPSI
jgi:hypothetical protein